jgi:hypothetical protein
VARGESARANADALRPVAERLATLTPASSEHETAYRSLQRQARTVLRQHPECAGDGIDLEHPAEPAITWWCPVCGGIDAPEECLGICIWRPVAWVERSLYERRREQAMSASRDEQCLRGLVRRIAFVTPRAGQWERGWNAIQADARETLESCAGAAAAERRTTVER